MAKTRARAGLIQPKRTQYGQRVYDSIWEAKCAKRLDDLMLAKEVEWWCPQPWVELGTDFAVKIDFFVLKSVRDHPHRRFLYPYFVESKGPVETERFRMVRKLWPKYGPYPLHIWRPKRETEIINPS